MYVLHKQEACPDPVMATHGILPHCPYMLIIDFRQSRCAQIGEIARDLDFLCLVRLHGDVPVQLAFFGGRKHFWLLC